MDKSGLQYHGSSSSSADDILDADDGEALINHYLDEEEWRAILVDSLMHHQYDLGEVEYSANALLLEECFDEAVGLGEDEDHQSEAQEQLSTTCHEQGAVQLDLPLDCFEDFDCR